MFGCEGGGGGGRRIKTDKRTTSGLRLDAREVMVVVEASKLEKKTTSSSHLDTREVVALAV